MGRSINENPVAAKSCIGYLPEGAPLYGELSPRMFLHFIATARQLSPTATKDRIAFVTDTLHLAPIFDQAIETLSKGFKRRVGLAMAILHDPDILILDEPTDGLDPIQKHEVRELITTMAQEKAIIISTHILEEVEAICDRVAVIHQGRIIANDTPGHLLATAPYHNAIQLNLYAPVPSDVLTTLKTLPSAERVEHVRPANGVEQFIVFSPDHTLALRDISTLAHTHNWAIQSLLVMQGKLDDVFRRLITDNLSDKKE